MFINKTFIGSFAGLSLTRSQRSCVRQQSEFTHGAPFRVIRVHVLQLGRRGGNKEEADLA